jgi:hypothetical protein
LQEFHGVGEKFSTAIYLGAVGEKFREDAKI